MKILLQLIGLRRRIVRHIMLPGNHSAVRADQTNLLPGGLQNRFQHIGAGCLAFRSGQTDRRHLPGGMIEPGGGKLRQRQTRIRDTNHCHILRNLYLTLDNNR